MYRSKREQKDNNLSAQPVPVATAPVPPVRVPPATTQSAVSAAVTANGGVPPGASDQEKVSISNSFTCNLIDFLVCFFFCLGGAYYASAPVIRRANCDVAARAKKQHPGVEGTDCKKRPGTLIFYSPYLFWCEYTAT